MVHYIVGERRILSTIKVVCSFFFSSRRRHTRYWRDWSSDVCSSDLGDLGADPGRRDGLAVDFDQRRHLGLELAAGAQHLRVALGLGAEAEVLADRDSLGGKALDQIGRAHV